MIMVYGNGNNGSLIVQKFMVIVVSVFYRLRHVLQTSLKSINRYYFISREIFRGRVFIWKL